MPEYVAIATATVPILNGAPIEFLKNAPCSILLVAGKIIINDRRGFFIITEETRDSQFRLAALLMPRYDRKVRGPNKAGTNGSATALYKALRQRKRRAVLVTYKKHRNKFNTP